MRIRRARTVTLVCAAATTLTLLSCVSGAGWAQDLPAAVRVKCPPDPKPLKPGEINKFRQRIEKLVKNDPRPLYQASSKRTLALNTDAAVIDFLWCGHLRAAAWAKYEQELDDRLVKAVLATHGHDSATYQAALVVATAQQDVLAKKHDFRLKGFASAQNADKELRSLRRAKEAKLAEADRRFVENLATSGPGRYVRDEAARALRAGDNGVADFFAYGWKSAADLDTLEHQVRTADREVESLCTLWLLESEAEEAERAYRESSEAMKAKARATADSAWDNVRAQAGTFAEKWVGESENAAAIADVWQGVAASARASRSESTGQNWDGVAGFADGNETTWRDLKTAAADKSEWWKRQATDALARKQDASAQGGN